MKITIDQAITQLKKMLKSLKEMPACSPANVSYVVHDLTEDVKELQAWRRLALQIGSRADWLPESYSVALHAVGKDLGGKLYAKWSNVHGILRKLERASVECGRGHWGRK